MATASNRIARLSRPNQQSGCVEWIGHVNDSGYGVMWFEGSTLGAHRAAWIEANGSIPEGMHVLHRCDNRRCVNPDHLFLGTNCDNVADKVAKGRQYRPDAKGSRNNMAKLNEEKVVRIKKLIASGLSNRQIAVQFGVSIMSISRIRCGHGWQHVYAEAA